MRGRDRRDVITARTSDRSVTSPPRRISGAAHGDPACAGLARLAPPPTLPLLVARYTPPFPAPPPADYVQRTVRRASHRLRPSPADYAPHAARSALSQHCAPFPSPRLPLITHRWPRAAPRPAPDLLPAHYAPCAARFALLPHGAPVPRPAPSCLRAACSAQRLAPIPIFPC